MNLKVAVVDDEAPIRQWLTYCIGTIAPEDKISTAANGAEALEMMEQVQPDIVFTDICMPVMDGLEPPVHVCLYQADRRRGGLMG